MADIESKSSTSPAGKTVAEPKKKCNTKLWLLLAFIACAGGAIGGVLGGVVLNKGRWIEGSWVSNYGTYVTVTATHWYAVSPWGTTVYAIDQKTDSYTIMQNPSTASYNADKWTKNEYHPIKEGWGFCSSVYDGESAKAALEKDTTEIYKKEDEEKGCNSFPFTKMAAFKFPIAGSWKTNYDQTLTLTATSWTTKGKDSESVYKIEAFGKNFVLMQNPSDAKYNPSKWTKVEFHTVGDGFGYCMSIFAGETGPETMSTSTKTIYNSANATAGCNGFPHTIASPA
jgi:hypothetical protein